MSLKELLDKQILDKNTFLNLHNYPDPLQVASRFKDPYIALICALFAYGNAKLIVKFLNSINYEILNENESEILKYGLNFKYRFQNNQDIAQILLTIKRLKDLDIEAILVENFNKNYKMIDAINGLILKIYSLNSYNSQGYSFFFGKNFAKTPTSPYKRYNMYLRWMVRDSDIDLGLFKALPKSELLLPLDTHTHKVSLKLGLCLRSSYDFKSVIQITNKLKEFDKFDPIKYDFALYRLGQSGEINQI